MVGHDKAIAALKKLLQTPITASGREHGYHVMFEESDRAAIILLGSMVDTSLSTYIGQKFKSLNSDEKKELFRFEAPLGSFSNRIKFAQALGMATRTERRMLDTIREMRNAAAHANARVDFETVAIVAGVVSMFSNDQAKIILDEEWPAACLRGVYAIICMKLLRAIDTGRHIKNLDGVFRSGRRSMKREAQRLALLEKLSAQ